jgi:outer membrane protein assembly factor BamB
LLDNKLFTVLNDTTFVCVDILSKEQLVKIDFNSKVMNFQHIGGLNFLLNIDNYGIALVNMTNGGNISYSVLYDYNICNTPDMSPYSIAFNDKYFFVTDFNCKTISAIEISTGKIVWDKIIDNKTTTSNLFYYENKLFVGINYYYKGGKIVVINASNGNLMKEIECNFESRFPSILNKNKIYYYTYFGSLNKSSIYEFNLSTMVNKEICSFNKNNDISGRPVQLLDDYLYFTDNENFFNKVNINTLKKSKIRKSDEILYGVFRKGKKVNFIWGNETITGI